MNNQSNTKLSKFLSYVLRHHPEKVDIKLDKNGWIEVDELIEKSTLAGTEFTREELEEVVSINDKQRFGFNEDKTKIRANQGHTIKVDLKLKAIKPPDMLYHGTVEKAMSNIRKEGLKPISRHHVHMSADIDTATKVGSRRGKALILEINAKAMYADKFKFYKSENGVWLTDNVPFKYITESE